MASEIATTHHETHDTDHHDGHHHVTPPRVYWTVFALLLILMALTIWVSFLNLGVMNNVVAMAIAITKATLVVLFFMQVKYGTRLTWLWSALGFIWFLLMFGILSDYVSREWLHVAGWQAIFPHH